MNKLINSDKFLAALSGRITVSKAYIQVLLESHLKDIVDEPHHPSGMDRHDIDVRNSLREEMRNE